MTRDAIPTIDEWRRLYQAAGKLKKAAPWEWMEERDVFGVQDPDSCEIGFISFMGSLGEHLAMAVYLGPEALSGFWRMQETARVPPQGEDHFMERIDLVDMLFEIPQLQASFEDRSELTAEDRSLIKELGLGYRGRQAWPMFRSIRPGHYPWYLEADEVRFLTHTLEQGLHVAERSSRDIRAAGMSGKSHYLVRFPQRQGRELVWEDRIVPISLVDSDPAPNEIDASLKKKLQRLHWNLNSIEMDLFMVPTPVHDQGQRPYFLYVLFMVEGEEGMIVGNEVLKPEPHLKALQRDIPNVVARQFVKMGSLPHHVQVASERLAKLLRPMIEVTEIQMEMVSSLPHLDEAKHLFREWFLFPSMRDS